MPDERGRGRPGELTPVVFLPGASGSAEFWRPVAGLLAGAGETILLGWPGFGDVPPDASIGSLDDLYRWCGATPTR